ncbi:hypothetical protein BX666DRAFT_1902959 [Dichotomocladium elegans]|nr:hypothetical protein BX666DRAFT_1902959 [Dichotomocladium elegans]
MRFSLALVSSAMLATAAFAAPALRSDNTDMKVSSEAPAAAIPLELGEAFQAFHFSMKDDRKVVDRTFVLDLPESAELQITDYMLGGDSFEVVDNGAVIGSTRVEAETNEGANIMAEMPENALQDKRFSHGSFVLAPGHHEISLNVIASPHSDGTGAIRLVRQVNSFLAGDDGDDDKDDDDEDCEDDEKDYKEDKEEKKWDGKKKKIVYVYHTVSPSANPTQTLTQTVATTTVPGTVTDVVPSTAVEETTDYVLLSLPWLTV